MKISFKKSVCMNRIFFSYSVIVCAITMSLIGSVAVAQDTLPINKEDMVALTKPSVVRIAQHVKGTATIPAITIDLKHWSVAIDTSQPAQTVPVDEVLSGSGFVVSTDGYIVTNSHVVSLQTTKMDVMTNMVLPAMYDGALALNEDETKKVFQDEIATFEFSKKVFEFVSAHSSFDVTQDIAVLNPSSHKEKLDELIAEGFPVRIVSVNDHFYDDGKDVALIKIEQDNLPTVSLGTSDLINVGKQVSLFGFPSTAEFNQHNPLESTFTQGNISALKDSENKDFKVFQTDAKVSEGSSGGPLVDDDGTVLGIVTFQTDQLQKNSGDNFAFAIPIEMAQKMIDDTGVHIQPSEYQSQLQQGMQAMQSKRCASALTAFDRAHDKNTSFEVSRYTDPYRARCQLLLASGQSVDTLQSRVQSFFTEMSLSLRLITGIIILFSLSLVCMMWWLVREVHKEEDEIHVLEKRLRDEDKQISADHKLIEKLSKKKT